MDGTTLREMASKHNLNIRHLKSTVNSDTTLFFIHGSMGSLTMYSSLIEKYEGKVNIVAYDTMGCGLSDKPELKTEYSTEALTKYAVEIFETFSTAKNVLIGHSYGTAQIARYIYIYIFTYMHIYAYIYTYINMYVHKYMDVYIFIDIYICT
jgi:pimeloyl-ACP methyl ester carboxylesterase